MPHPVHVPRVNNNDDTVKLVHLAVRAGDFVRRGDLLLEVETEKAAVAVEAEQDGYVLGPHCQEGDTLTVGAVALWLGDQPDEAVPEIQQATEQGASAEPTAKARLLLDQHGLTAGAIPRSGPRLTAADVEAFLATTGHPRGLTKAGRPADLVPASPPSGVSQPEPGDLPAPAEIAPLTAAERGVLNTVSWQRDHAVAAFLELEYDPRPWQAYGAAFGGDKRPLLDPTLALMAHRLALLAAATGANGSVLEDVPPSRVRYRQVNLGFTVQARGVLYLCVVEAADTLEPAAFVARFNELQRRAMAHKLTAAESRGATVGFTSMARWGVRRHIPVLAPYSALMVAHGGAFSTGDRAVLGATYDHRLLSGFDAARLLRLLADPARAIPDPKDPA